MAASTTPSTALEQFIELQNEVLEWYRAEVTEEYIDLDQPPIQAHVLQGGEGEPVVFIHGGGGEAMMWAPLLAQMQDEFALYAPDRPGCGLSDRFTYGNVDLHRYATDCCC